MIRLALRALVRAAPLTIAGLVLLATPAAADAAGPTDYRSEVTGIDPEVDGVRAAIVGGDAFLELTVAPGTEVVVAGYEDEPYLRVLADGTVEHNLRSPTTYLNEDREGGASVPPSADADAAPEWESIAGGGQYAWHDHRTHWMGATPPAVERGEQVGGAYDPWRVPITIDGEAAEIQGTLTYESAVSPLPWIALALVVSVAIAVAARRAPLVVAGAALLVVAILAAVVGWAEYDVSPTGAGANPLLWALPLVAAAGALTTLVLRRRPAIAAIAALAAIAVLTAWGLLRLGVLLHPVLPSSLPDWLDRAAVALSLGVSAGGAWAVVTSGALALPSLDDAAPEA